MKLLSKLKARLPAWAWAGATSGVAGFVSGFALSALGWLGDVASWASSQGQDPFPDSSVLGYAAVGAAVGVATAAVNAAYRWAQTRWLPGNGPVYPPG
jgi:hypothetical protein